MNNEKNSGDDVSAVIEAPTNAEYVRRIRAAAHREQSRVIMGALGRAFGRIAAAVRNSFAAYDAANELARMSDRDLADIGIHRGEILNALRANPIADASRSKIPGLSRWSPASDEASNDRNRFVA
jgi:uncharacterized protein YjiS (DUF1127 family)